MKSVWRSFEDETLLQAARNAMARAVLFSSSLSAESVQLIVEFSQPLAFYDFNFAGFILGHTILHQPDYHHQQQQQQLLSTERMFPNWHFEVERCVRLVHDNLVPRNLLEPTFYMLNEVRQMDRLDEWHCVPELERQLMKEIDLNLYRGEHVSFRAFLPPRNAQSLNVRGCALIIMNLLMKGKDTNARSSLSANRISLVQSSFIMLFKGQRFLIVSRDEYPRVVTPEFCYTNAHGRHVLLNPRNAQETFFYLDDIFSLICGGRSDCSIKGL
eukprot:TRINITY_DN558_c0_g1_i3.p1 TRINITY_DN558_c0_g1~~TRINITY_DN558_c0_g1_i3.p1  ORF type:complete len:271 (-),score=36.77 TRINITY_DN558_c0_g1_i3:237-1049(-)